MWRWKMKITDLMNQLQAESKNQAIKDDNYACAFGDFSGVTIQSTSFVVRTNSKKGVVNSIWYADGKKISRDKLVAMFA
jgi:hypothetical protein